MNPTIQYELARAAIADLNSQAMYHRLAQAQRRAPRLPRDHGHHSVSGHLAAMLDRWLHATLPVRPLAR